MLFFNSSLNEADYLREADAKEQENKARIAKLEAAAIQKGSKPSLDLWMSSLPAPARMDYGIVWLYGETYVVLKY